MDKLIDKIVDEIEEASTPSKMTADEAIEFYGRIIDELNIRIEALSGA